MFDGISRFSDHTPLPQRPGSLMELTGDASRCACPELLRPSWNFWRRPLHRTPCVQKRCGWSRTGSADAASVRSLQSPRPWPQSLDPSSPMMKLV